jgi:hypothetical protein
MARTASSDATTWRRSTTRTSGLNFSAAVAERSRGPFSNIFLYTSTFPCCEYLSHHCTKGQTPGSLPVSDAHDRTGQAWIGPRPGSLLQPHAGILSTAAPRQSDYAPRLSGGMDRSAEDFSRPCPRGCWRRFPATRARMSRIIKSGSSGDVRPTSRDPRNG